MKTILWMLITVTYGGNVGTSSYPSKHLCEQAKSLALTGDTIEENERRESERREFARQATERWNVDHPCDGPSLRKRNRCASLDGTSADPKTTEMMK